MNKKKIVVFVTSIVILMILISACAASPAEEMVEPAAEEAAPMAASKGGGEFIDEMMMEAPAMDVSSEYANSASEPSASAGDSYLSVERLIIRNGEINMEVNDTRQVRDEIRGIVNKLSEQGAFVLSTNEYEGDTENTPTINMVIRIPADSFDNVMEQITGMAVVVNNSSEYSEDVTEEYYDLENRLDSLEAARQRLLEIMEKAENTEDLLKAEQQLTQRETEIESLKGRQKYLSQSAKLSRISNSLQPYHLAQPIDTTWKPLETMREAIDDLIDGLKGFVDFLIYFIIAVAPWLALFGYIIWQVVKYANRRRKKGKTEGEE